MSDDSNKNDKKDLTGILELSSLVPPASAEEMLKDDPFVVNVEQPLEHVDDFESLDDIGMMDHAPEVDFQVSPTPDFESIQSFEQSIALPVEPSLEEKIEAADLARDTHPDDNAAPIGIPEFAAPPLVDPMAPVAEIHAENALDATTGLAQEARVAQGAASDTNDLMQGLAFEPSPEPRMQDLKDYTERSRESAFASDTKVSFHLHLSGRFDPFARDRLLIFVTENSVGMNARELDAQIDAGRVFFSRISEFAGIKLIQELRDSGLTFKLTPSPRDSDEVIPQSDGIRLEFHAQNDSEATPMMPVLPDAAITETWVVFDSIQLVQFLKAEMVEVERSELFQDLLDRMERSIKNKALLKGAAALSSLKHEIKPMRLPSHYQVEMKASLLRKK